MSTLLQVRTDFVTQTGRYDLVVDTTDYADNGADFLIKAGQRWLDMKQWHRKSVARYKKDLAAGDHIVNIQNLRSAQEVWIANSDGRLPLSPKSLAWLREEYAKDPSDETQGTPEYYALTAHRLAPEQKALTSSNYTTEFTYDVEDVMFPDEGDAFLYDSIIIMPPPDEAYTLEVIGYFFSVLENDTDKSFWSVNYPEVCVLAAMLAETMFFKNSEGMKDLVISIDEFLSGIDKDHVDWDVAQFNQIGG